MEDKTVGCINREVGEFGDAVCGGPAWRRRKKAFFFTPTCNSHFIPVNPPLDNPQLPFPGPGPRVLFKKRKKREKAGG